MSDGAKKGWLNGIGKLYSWTTRRDGKAQSDRNDVIPSADEDAFLMTRFLSRGAEADNSPPSRSANAVRIVVILRDSILSSSVRTRLRPPVSPGSYMSATIFNDARLERLSISRM